METLKTRGGVATKLVETLQGLNVPSENVTALKYGRNIEHIAKQKFVKMFEKDHKAAQCTECGLFLLMNSTNFLVQLPIYCCNVHVVGKEFLRSNAHIQ